MIICHSRSLDAVDLVPEAGDSLEAGEVGDGVDEEEAVAPAEELLAHRAVLLLAGSVQHLESWKGKRGDVARDYYSQKMQCDTLEW